MFRKILRSWALTRTSWRVLRKDKEILLVPALCGFTSLAGSALMLSPLILRWLEFGAQSAHSIEYSVASFLEIALLLPCYLLASFLSVFCSVAVMKCAAIRMDGGDPSLADGLRGALAHIWGILAWSAVASTVGVVLSLLTDEDTVVGDVFASFLGFAWSGATFLFIPVLAFENRGVRDSLNRSAELVRRTWGEALVGNIGLGLVFELLALPGLIPLAVAIVCLLQGAPPVPTLLILCPLSAIWWIALGILWASLKSIFLLAVYRYAAKGQASGDYSPALLESCLLKRMKRRMVF